MKSMRIVQMEYDAAEYRRRYIETKAFLLGRFLDEKKVGKVLDYISRLSAQGLVRFSALCDSVIEGAVRENLSIDQILDRLKGEIENGVSRI